MKYFLLLFLFIFGCQSAKRSDLVLTNANIITVNEKQPTASDLAVIDGRIIYVGDSTGIKKYIDQKTQVIDLKGKTIIPGFIDAHAHLMSLGKFLLNVDLSNIKNWDDAKDLVAQAVKNSKPGEWIIGRQWHQEKWDKMPVTTIMEYPVHGSISNISPDNPVILEHASGHGIFVNAKAMQIAGVNMNTPHPAGGEIVKDDQGNPTGIFLENAQNLIAVHYNRYLESLSNEDQRSLLLRKIQAASKHSLENGITTFHDAGTYFDDLDLLKELASNNSLDIRIWAMISSEEVLTDENLQKYWLVGFGNNFLTIRSIKQYADGALGSRGAWMLEHYSDMPFTSGSNLTPLDEIKKTADLAFKHGYQLCTHAIGDRGNREILDIYQNVLDDAKDKRWRIEHAQHLSKDDIPRFSELAIIASMQTVHCTSDGPWVPKRIGNKRAEDGAYVWQKLLENGAKFANGTDAPVERLSPLENYYAAVTRQLKDGARFYPEQVLSRKEALASLTIWNAYAGFEEEIKGTIEVGKLADLVVLSQNILTVPEEEILKTLVDYTIVDGKVKFIRK